EEQRQHEMRVPDWLLQIVSRCLEKHPEARYKNGMELQKAIEYGPSLAPPLIEIEQEQVPSYPLQEADGIRLSTTMFAILMTLLVVLLIYSGYSFFNKPAVAPKTIVVKPVDSVSKADSAEQADRQRSLNYIRKRKAIDSAVQRAIKEQMYRDGETEQDSLKEDTTQSNPTIN
ncbi:MAG: hypothetical protein ABIN91_10505, partial [Mucilaginibacter sp.]|uniref:hypothetical protein n=1 Tax=Mucilaginibacter sp. TaxID=1882438 RepID=UPI003267828A